MRNVTYYLASAALLAGVALAGPQSGPDDRSTRAILESYVDDFRHDPAAAVARKFGIRITDDGGSWTVVVHGTKGEKDQWKVDLVDGSSDQQQFVYTTDEGTLAAIDAGRINALTAAGKAFPGDPTPMEFEWTPGAKEFDINPFSFHFWTRGFPERIPFERSMSRVVHGCNAVIFYYQKGFRSGWASLAKGQGANNGPGNPIMAPFPTLVIVVRGEVQGRVGGKVITTKAGETVFVPANTPHEWWNEKDEQAETVLVWFGEGA